MEGQSSLMKQAKFSRRILCSRQRIIQSPMPNEHPECIKINETCQLNLQTSARNWKHFFTGAAAYSVLFAKLPLW